MEVVRRIFRARGIEWVHPPDALEPGTRRGIDDFTVSLIGDQVVAIGILRGRGDSSGMAIERRQGDVWRIREGGRVRFAWVNDRAEALEAAGLSG